MTRPEARRALRRWWLRKAASRPRIALQTSPRRGMPVSPAAALCLAWGAVEVAAVAGAVTYPAALAIAPVVVAVGAFVWSYLHSR